MKKQYLLWLVLVHMNSFPNIFTTLASKSPYTFLCSLSSNVSSRLTNALFEKASTNPSYKPIDWKSVPSFECFRTMIACIKTRPTSTPSPFSLYPLSTLKPFQRILETIYRTKKEPLHAQ